MLLTHFSIMSSCDDCWIGMQCDGSSPSSFWDDGSSFDSATLSLDEDCRSNREDCLYIHKHGSSTPQVKRKECDHNRKTLCTAPMVLGWYC